MILKRLITLLLVIAFSATATGAEVKRLYPGLIYPDQERTEFLKAVLTSMNLPFTETVKPVGVEVRWKSFDKSLANEIEKRVGQWYFIKTICNNIELPSPTRPALKELSCKN